jgi:hypothetical protein
MWMGWKGINGIIEVGMFWALSRDAVTSLWGCGSQHILHQNTPPQQQQIYYLSFKEGVQNEEQRL